MFVGPTDVPFSFRFHKVLLRNFVEQYVGAPAPLRLAQCPGFAKNLFLSGWDDIGYSFLIGGDGRVYVGRGRHRQGAHTYRYNSVAQGVVLMGLYTERAPPHNMLDATQRLIQCGVSKVKYNVA